MSQEILNPEQADKLKLADLKAEYAKLHTAYTTVVENGADEALKTLLTDNAAQIAKQAAQIAELEAKLAESDNADVIKTLKATIESLYEEIAQFETKLKIGGNPKVVKHNGVFYKVALPKVNVNGTIYTAEQLCQPENADVVDELINIGSGALVAQKEA